MSVNLHNLRDYTEDRHQNVDDAPYGGGPGMVMLLEPIIACLEKIKAQNSRKKTRVLMTSPDGKVYNQRLAADLAHEEHLVLLCGHFKGIDERVSHFVDDRVSVGDYVLSGGEIPALVIVDSIARLLPGVVSDMDSVLSDSHSTGLLGAPCYTRPGEFQGLKVPDVLLSGDHKRIEEFRFVESVRRTAESRPDILALYRFSKQERKILKKNGLENLIPRSH